MSPSSFRAASRLGRAAMQASAWRRAAASSSAAMPAHPTFDFQPVDVARCTINAAVNTTCFQHSMQLQLQLQVSTAQGTLCRWRAADNEGIIACQQPQTVHVPCKD